MVVIMNMYIVDSFTEEKFKGNPAAVCILDYKLKDSDMKNIAMEMNLSETAFLYKKKNNNYDLRWFTPQEEVNLCGHATLASAHILIENGFEQKGEQIRFNTLSGLLTANSENESIILNFPKQLLKESNGDEYLLRAITGSIIKIMEDQLSYVIVLENENEVIDLKPNFDLLYKTLRKEVIITAKSNNMEYDFVSRFFAPAIGIKEDPVTGSAHCYLAPYWGKVLNKKSLIGYQASKRGGIIQCTLKGDRVLLKGRACTVLSGEINI